MPSYETLAVIVLALSATPAFSAPVVDNQQQARAAIEEEPASGGSGLLPGVLKSAGIGAGLSILGDAEKHFFGNHTRREPFHFHDFLPAIDRREPLSAGSLGKTALGFIASSIGSDIADHFLNHTRREPEPGEASKIFGDVITAGGIASKFLRREELESRDPNFLGTVLKDGEGIISKILRREELESRDPNFLSTALKDGEGIIAKILKRELESRESEAGKIFGDVLTAGGIAAKFLRREELESRDPNFLGTVLKDGEGIISKILKREELESRDPNFLGTALKDGEGIISKILKRELESRESEAGKIFNDVLTVGGVASKFLRREELESRDPNFLGNVIKDGEGIISKILKREELESRDPNFLSTALKDGEGIISKILKRELESRESEAGKIFNDVLTVGGVASKFLRREELEELESRESKLLNDIVSAGGLIAHVIKRQQLDELD